MKTSVKQLIDLELEKPWTSEKALAVYDLLTELAELIRHRYENEILDAYPDQDLAGYHYCPRFRQEDCAKDPDDDFSF